MTYNLVITPLAEQDIESALDWYQSQDEKLVPRLFSKIEEALKQIQEHPEHYQKRYKEIRIVFTQKFPYGIYYTLEAETIYVHAVLHTKQDPKTLTKR